MLTAALWGLRRGARPPARVDVQAAEPTRAVAAWPRPGMRYRRVGAMLEQVTLPARRSPRDHR